MVYKATSFVTVPMRSMSVTQWPKHSSSCLSFSVALLTKSFEAVTNCRESLVSCSFALWYVARGAGEAGDHRERRVLADRLDELDGQRHVLDEVPQVAKQHEEQAEVEGVAEDPSPLVALE